MYNIDEHLEAELAKFNVELCEKYREILSIDKSEFKDFVNQSIGEMKSMEKLKKEELKELNLKGGVVGVDGSVLKKGGAHPHYVEVFQGLAKSTKYEDKPIFRSRISSPLLSENPPSILDDDLEDDEKENKRDEYLSKIEVQVALASIEELKPHVIMMDGSLLRYSIDCKEEWEELRYQCEANKIFLIGVIEDTKTKIIGERLVKSGRSNILAYDRELLFGKLDLGEIILIDDRISGKGKSGGISSAFLRTSLTPNVIGMDILNTQRKHLEDMANLVWTLTPENSRGVPLWLDLVDEEVKVSFGMLDALLKKHLDRDIYERLFVETRSKRN